MKIKAILKLAGFIYVVTVFLLLLLDKREWVNYAVFGPVYLMLIYSFIVFVFSLITVPLYWVTLPFRKHFIKKGKLAEQNDAKIKPFFITATLLVALFAFYLCFFPVEDTFWSHYKRVTFRDPPPSARIITKGSGFYSECTSAIIQMAPKHYMKLLNQLQNDYRFGSESGIGGYDAFSEAMEGYNKDDINHTFFHLNNEPGTEYPIYQIGFFANQKWVVYLLCS